MTCHVQAPAHPIAIRVRGVHKLSHQALFHPLTQHFIDLYSYNLLHFTSLHTPKKSDSKLQLGTRSIPMASICVSTSSVGLVSYGKSSCPKSIITFPASSSKGTRPRVVVVKAEAQAINPEIRKTEEKVVDSVVVSELSKPLTPYCR